MRNLDMLHVSGIHIQRIIASVVFTLILGGCGHQMDIEKVKEELMNLDRAFSKLSIEKGSWEFVFDTGNEIAKKEKR